MERLSRSVLVLVAILTTAIILPKLYWMAFEKPHRVPFVLYSCINNDYLILRTDGEVIREDTKGNQYTREEYEQKLPLMYMRQLLVSGTMPDTINGVAMEMHDLSMARSFYRFRPEDMITPKPKLYPLFEAESGRAQLEMPEDFFRITWRVDFINANTNKIDEEKSRMFSAALFQKGFKFPAKKIEGIPTTRKSCDEGYLIIDAEDQLFHLKMMEGLPYVYHVDLPAGMTFKHISCVDNKDKRFYAYLFTGNDEIYILTQDEYELIKLPITGFHPETCELKIYSDYFHINVCVQDDDHLDVTTLNYDNFEVADNYHETWASRMNRSEGKVFSYLFPAQLSMTNPNTNFINFYWTFSGGYGWILLNLVLLVIHFFIIRKRNVKIKSQLTDLLVIVITGIFGFLAVNIFPNKFFD